MKFLRYKENDDDSLFKHKKLAQINSCVTTLTGYHNQNIMKSLWTVSTNIGENKVT